MGVAGAGVRPRAARPVHDSVTQAWLAARPPSTYPLRAPMTLLNSTPGLRLSTAREPTISTYTGRELAERLPALTAYVAAGQRVPLSRHPGWLSVLERGLGHTPYALEATRGERTVGVLPLAYVRSLLFGRFLVSLPYLNYGGAVADDDAAVVALTDRAVELAVQLRVRYLELRHEWRSRT